jgi:hypothetical protein
MGSKRTIITISDEDKLWLENYRRVHGISAAEAIRRGIARLKDEEGSSVYKKIIQETRGIWKEGDGLEHQKRARCAWVRSQTSLC